MPAPVFRHIAVGAVLIAAACSPSPRSNDWPIARGPGSTQYSPLAEITRDNVARLEVAWTYHSGQDETTGTQIQCTPIMIDGVLYGTSSRLEAFALDAATGRELWRFDPFAGREGASALGVSRGVTYWADGDDRRILLTGGRRLFAVDAGTGLPIETFGHGGWIDLREGLDRDIGDLFINSNTPGVIVENLIILPTRVAESDPSAPGHIRAFDVRTGERAWIFHTIPRPGEAGYEAWPPDAWRRAGGANSWAGMTVDETRGLVFVPTGSAAPDFYGADRVGANLYANSLLALDARTGKRVWHYQFVHHDLWDRDLPAPPNLVTVEHDGRRIDAVAQITKSGHVFLFDRDAGQPLFPIEEHVVPDSDLPGESAWPTQPLPVKPPPFARQRFDPADVSTLSPEVHDRLLERLERVRSDGQFVPPSLEGTVILPGFDGGGEWGGAAVDADGMLYVNAIDLNAGEIRWSVTLGELPELAARGLPPTGTENYGGPLVTAGGVLFIAATKDEKFRAFDTRDGSLLWETDLPAGGYATPATYEVGGRQLVVIAAGGGKMGTKSGDAYVAFALPH